MGRLKLAIILHLDLLDNDRQVKDRDGNFLQYDPETFLMKLSNEIAKIVAKADYAIEHDVKIDLHSYIMNLIESHGTRKWGRKVYAEEEVRSMLFQLVGEYDRQLQLVHSASAFEKVAKDKTMEVLSEALPIAFEKIAKELKVKTKSMIEA